MRRYLVVANQTLASHQLRQELLLRAESEESTFYFLVPETAANDYAQDWKGQGGAVSEAGSPGARQRLEQAIGAVRSAGAHATGSIESPDPMKSIHQRLRREEYDEVIVSTLPKTISRWLKRDLPSRVERAVGKPVTTIIAKGE